MENRFNRLTSKEWLPFQKSWSKFSSIENLYEENIRFFCKAQNEGDVIFYIGDKAELASKIAKKHGEKIITAPSNEKIQFIMIDLLDKLNNKTTLEEYNTIKADIIQKISAEYPKLLERRFVALFVNNIESENGYFPYAWDLTKALSTMLSLRDEKIMCLYDRPTPFYDSVFSTDNTVFYSMYLRKDEFSDGTYKPELLDDKDYFRQLTPAKDKTFQSSLQSWFILKPKPRAKNEVVHPAKYPEELVTMFVEHFTNEGDNVFDPMSGTGSTQLGAMMVGRNGYGTELSEFFAKLANDRCQEFLTPRQQSLFELDEKKATFKILNLDARLISNKYFPNIDYVLTSPPYWDMLNMKGAETQALRKKKGLQTNYSNSDKDLGNIADYNRFIDELCDIYENLFKLVKPGSYITIVVKNIKKQGRSYPFAWDLAERLQKKLILLPPTFWCQDDISIAPFGYGNTWVSNTFHQYCLNFQKPL